MSSGEDQFGPIIRQKILDSQAVPLPWLTRRDVWLPAVPGKALAAAPGDGGANTPMRLSAEQVQAIRQTARRVLGDGAWVSVFGSRALDDSKGGDIDLLFETDAPRTCFRHRQTYRYSPVSLRHLPEHAESALLALELARRHNRRLG